MAYGSVSTEFLIEASLEEPFVGEQVVPGRHGIVGSKARDAFAKMGDIL